MLDIQPAITKYCYLGPFYKSHQAMPNRMNFDQVLPGSIQSDPCKTNSTLGSASRTMRQRPFDCVDSMQLINQISVVVRHDL